MSKPKSLVSQKISVLEHNEKMPHKQAIAVAIHMGKAGRLRQGGRYVRKSSRK